MLIKPVRASTVEGVAPRSFFHMKIKERGIFKGFMCEQAAESEGDFSGSVVLVLPEEGGFSDPRPASAYLLTVALEFPTVEPFVDLESIEDSSTEALHLKSGRMLVAGSDFLFCLGGDFQQAKYVNFSTGEYILHREIKEWLSFTRWGLRLPDGTIVYRHDAAPAPQGQ